MRNRRGEGHILTCVLVLAIGMVASVLMVFATSISMVRYTKDNVALTLDSYVLEHAVEIYNAVKQGSNAIEEVDEGAYVAQLRQFASLDQRGEFLYAYGSDGRLNYYMSVPRFQEGDHTLQWEVSYTQYLPLRFMGEIVAYAQVPVTVTSVWTSKF